MKKKILPVLFCFFAIKGFAQTRSTYVYDAQGNMVSGSHIRTKPGKSVKLKDSNGNTFILDSLHINITAISPKGDTLWRTDPWKDNKIEVYRTKRPYIVAFNLVKEHGKEEIAIAYINSQFGTLNIKTGKFFFLGQD